MRHRISEKTDVDIALSYSIKVHSLNNDLNVFQGVYVNVHFQKW